MVYGKSALRRSHTTLIQPVTPRCFEYPKIEGSRCCMRLAVEPQQIGSAAEGIHLQETATQSECNRAFQRYRATGNTKTSLLNGRWIWSNYVNCCAYLLLWNILSHSEYFVWSVNRTEQALAQFENSSFATNKSQKSRKIRIKFWEGSILKTLKQKAGMTENVFSTNRKKKRIVFHHFSTNFTSASWK